MVVKRRRRIGRYNRACSSRSRGACAACTPCGRRPCSAWQGPVSIAKLGRTVATYRGCLRRSLSVSAAMAGLLLGGALAGVLLPTGAAAAVLALLWVVTTVRVVRLVPSCGSLDGGPGPGGAGVREPRRPKPCPPSGAVSLPMPKDPPDGAAALA